MLMSQFNRMEFARNPAAAGIVPGNNLRLFSRNDLGTPYTSSQFNYFAASFDGANDSSEVGFGLLAFFARELAFSTTNDPLNAYSSGLDLAFSYQTSFSHAVRFRIGGSLGLHLKSVPIVFVSNGLEGVARKLFPGLAFGILFEGERFRAGAAAFNLTNPTITFPDAPQLPPLSESRLYLLQGTFTAYEDLNWKIEPSAAVKFKQGRFPIADLALTGRFAHKVIFGAGARFGSIAPSYAVGQIGAVFGDYEVVLSYDMPLGQAGAIYLKYLEATVAATL